MATYSVRRRLKNDYFKLIIGSNDKKYPIVYYYNVKFYLTPTFSENIKESVNQVEKKFKKLINNTVRYNDNIEGTCIINFDIAKDRLAENKRSMYCIECFCKQKESNIIDVDFIDNKWFYDCLEKLYLFFIDEEFKIDKN